MNKLVLAFMLLCGVYMQGKAQDYIPLAVEDAQWLIAKWKQDDPFMPDGFYGYFIKGDTVINSITYKKVFFREFVFAMNPPLTVSNEFYFAAVRDDVENRKVYAYGQDDGNCISPEYLIHDFSLAVGDVCEYPTPICTVREYNITNVYSDNLFGKIRKIIVSQTGNPSCVDYFIEGVGNQTGLFEPAWCFESLLSLDTFCVGKDCMSNLFVSSINTIKTVKYATITPNPVLENFNLTLTYYNSNQNCKYILSDITGRQIIKQNIESAVTTINMESLQVGIYFITIYNENQIIQTQKIIKL